MEALITTRGLSKNYGKTESLKNINLEIPQGEIVGILGANGAGKTTLLRSITGQIEYTFKERSDRSTYFYRSLPISDHLVIGSKIISGLICVFVLCLALSVEIILGERIASALATGDKAAVFESAWQDLSLFGLIGESVVLTAAALIRFLPAAMYLVTISAWVKTRPILIGVGIPTMVGFVSYLIFDSSLISDTLAGPIISPFQMVFDQPPIHDEATGVWATNLGDFAHYLYSLESLISIGIAIALFFVAMVL